ncbi:MAG: GNAT family N-acetyltransferase, partial [Lysinibacillus sp.]
MNVLVRPLERKDYKELVVLMEELGYPATAEEIGERFDKLDGHPDYTSLVAVLNGAVVGFSGMCRMHYFEMNGMYVRILSFVVSSAARKQGVGSILLEASENWAAEQGCTGIALNSGNRPERQAAHAFYTANGYQVKSSGFA